MNMGFIYLALAITAEVFATSFMKATDGFSKWQPTALVLLGYSCSFYLLSLVVKTVPIGIAYAIWAGAGIVLITLIGLFYYGQKLDLPATIGIILIMAGVMIIQMFSKVQMH